MNHVWVGVLQWFWSHCFKHTEATEQRNAVAIHSFASYLSYNIDGLQLFLRCSYVASANVPAYKDNSSCLGNVDIDSDTI